MKLLCQLFPNSRSVPYLACQVHDFVVKPYVEMLLDVVSTTKALKLVSNQQLRDGKGHHCTIAAPGEASDDLIGKFHRKWLEFEIVGLGRAFDGVSEAAFIVLDSPDADNVRTELGLKPRDFHITIGFDPKDIHDRHKGHSSIVRFSKDETQRKKTRQLIERFDRQANFF